MAPDRIFFSLSFFLFFLFPPPLPFFPFFFFLFSFLFSFFFPPSFFPFLFPSSFPFLFFFPFFPPPPQFLLPVHFTTSNKNLVCVFQQALRKACAPICKTQITVFNNQIRHKRCWKSSHVHSEGGKKNYLCFVRGLSRQTRLFSEKAPYYQILKLY